MKKKDRAFSYVENMEAQFAIAQAEVEKQIAAWYQRFAANNEITLVEAKRLLNGRELEELRWTVRFSKCRTIRWVLRPRPFIHGVDAAPVLTLRI